MTILFENDIPTIEANVILATEEPQRMIFASALVIRGWYDNNSNEIKFDRADIKISKVGYGYN